MNYCRIKRDIWGFAIKNWFISKLSFVSHSNCFLLQTFHLISMSLIPPSLNSVTSPLHLPFCPHIIFFLSFSICSFILPHFEVCESFSLWFCGISLPPRVWLCIATLEIWQKKKSVLEKKRELAILMPSAFVYRADKMQHHKHNSDAILQDSMRE